MTSILFKILKSYLYFSKETTQRNPTYTLPIKSILNMNEESGIQYLREYLIDHNLTISTRVSPAKNGEKIEPMTTTTELSESTDFHPVFLSDVEITNLLKKFLKSHEVDVEFAITLDVSSTINIDFLRKNISSSLSRYFLKNVFHWTEAYYEVCTTYIAKIDFMIFHNLSHFWVMFDRETWGDVIKALEKQRKIKEFKPDTEKAKEIEKISQAVHRECRFVDGFDLEDDEDDQGPYIPHVRSKGDCGVDVVRIIIMFHEKDKELRKK